MKGSAFFFKMNWGGRNRGSCQRFIFSQPSHGFGFFLVAFNLTGKTPEKIAFTYSSLHPTKYVFCNVLLLSILYSEVCFWSLFPSISCTRLKNSPQISHRYKIQVGQFIEKVHFLTGEKSLHYFLRNITSLKETI